MTKLMVLTAGESHGPMGTAIVSGMPSDVPVDVEFINSELRRRQGGYGRGGRQRIETDAVTITAGVRLGKTTGAPIVLTIPNKDSRLDDLAKTPAVHRPRPGHADLSGAMKWLTTDCRNALERASARETAARTAAGALAKLLLREFNITAFGFVRSIHEAESNISIDQSKLSQLQTARDESEVSCPDKNASEKMIEAIRAAKIDKNTVGGIIETHVFNVPFGLGSCVQWDQKLDGRLAQAVMSIQAFKSVEIGMGRETAMRRGSDVHDPIHYDSSQKNSANLGYTRPRNNAGGIEGGMTNGMPIVVRAAMKPISTLLQGMPSVDLNSKKSEQSSYERSDVCAVPAASVVMENVVAFEIARAFLEKFAGDSLTEVRGHYEMYHELARKLPLETPTKAAGLEAEQTEA